MRLAPSIVVLFSTLALAQTSAPDSARAQQARDWLAKARAAAKPLPLNQSVLQRHYRLARLYVLLGDSAGAEAIADDHWRPAHRAVLYVHIGSALAAQNRTREASKAYQRALALSQGQGERGLLDPNDLLPRLAACDMEAAIASLRRVRAEGQRDTSGPSRPAPTGDALDASLRAELATMLLDRRESVRACAVLLDAIRLADALPEASKAASRDSIVSVLLSKLGGSPPMLPEFPPDLLPVAEKLDDPVLLAGAISRLAGQLDRGGKSGRDLWIRAGKIARTADWSKATYEMAPHWLASIAAGLHDIGEHADAAALAKRLVAKVGNQRNVGLAATLIGSTGDADAIRDFLRTRNKPLPQTDRQDMAGAVLASPSPELYFEIPGENVVRYGAVDMVRAGRLEAAVAFIKRFAQKPMVVHPATSAIGELAARGKIAAAKKLAAAIPEAPNSGDLAKVIADAERTVGEVPGPLFGNEFLDGVRPTPPYLAELIARKEFDAAARYAQVSDNGTHGMVERVIKARLAAGDVAGARKMIDARVNVSDDVAQQALRRAVYRAEIAAAKDPGTALQLARLASSHRGRQGEQLPDGLLDLFKAQLGAGDAAGAKETVATLRTDAVAQRPFDACSTYLQILGQAALALDAAKQPEEAASLRAWIVETADKRAPQDPSKTNELALGQAAPYATAIGHIARDWVVVDAAAAAKWTESLSRSDFQFAAYVGLVRGVCPEPPESEPIVPGAYGGAQD